MRIRVLSPFWVFLIIFLIHHSIVLSEASGTKANRMEVNRNDLVLKGNGTLLYAWVIKVYTARLCGSRNLKASNLLKNKGPVRLEINYDRSISRDLIIKAANAILKKQVPPNRLETIQKRIEKLHLAYRDIRAGDSYWLDYMPDRGTALLFNGKEVERIPGWDFAQAYFGIWLADPPISKSLKKQLIHSKMGEGTTC